MGSPSLLGASRGGTKLQNRHKLDKSKLSYADLHSEVVKDVKYMHPTSPSSHRKQPTRVEATKREVFVKHVPRLPIYLEKEIKVMDKPLDIGVIDWRSLEDWQYYNSRTPIRSTRYSSPSNITSKFFDGSSIRQRRGHSSSPLGRRGRRPTLQSYLDLSTSEGHLEFVKSSWRNTNKFQDKKVVPTDSLDGHGNTLKEFQFFNKKPSEVKLKECGKKILDHNNIPSPPKTKTSPNFDGHRAPSPSKGKFEAKYNEYMKISKKLLDQSDEMPHLVSPDRHKNIVLLLSRDGPGKTGAAISCSSESNDQKSIEHTQMSLEGFHFEELYRTNFCSNIPHSLPPQDIEGSQKEQHVSADTKKFKFFPTPPSKIKSDGPPKNKFEEVKSAVMPKVSTLTNTSRESDMNLEALPMAKVRNASPKRLLGIGLSKIGILANPKNRAVVPQFGFEVVTANSGVEGGDSSSCTKCPTSHMPDTIRKDRSSPLRRLLDPLLKPKAAKSHSLPQSNDYSTSSDKGSTSFHVVRKPSSVHSTNVNLDLTSLKDARVDLVHHRETRESSTIQAYVKVAIKNNLPLYTFTVENNTVVLAATVKKFSSRKDDTTRIYTFFKIHETKKSVGWLNYGPKNKECIPNVIAQMKVSDLQNLDSNDKHLADKFISKEYVLFATDLRLFDHQPSDFHPNDELAGAPDPSHYPHFDFHPISDNMQEFLVQKIEQEKEAYGHVVGIIYDTLMYCAEAVADNIKIPSMIIGTSFPTYVLATIAMPRLHAEDYLPLQDSMFEEPVPEFYPLRFKDLPSTAGTIEESLALYAMTCNLRSSSAIIWNTVDFLENLSLPRLQQHYKVPFFTVGPFHKIASMSSSTSLLEEDRTCMAWLDKQATNSVIYVSLGSLASIDAQELTETAWGLANSGQPFLWVIRPGSVIGSEWIELLPEGFIENIGERYTTFELIIE